MSLPSRRYWSIRLCLVLALSLFAAGHGSAQGTWGYTVGELRSDQQANFCFSEAAALEIAGLFERFSPRTGYTALADSPDCTIAVHSFVPQAILAVVEIEPGEADAYRFTFLRVRTTAGRTLFLITTREVRLPQ